MDEQQPNELLETYQLAVEMADRVSARRGLANQFYLSIETLILGAPALFHAVGNGTANEPFRSAMLAFVGSVISVVWWVQLRSYRKLNAAKFAVITRMEAEHFQVRVFTDEWAALAAAHAGRWRSRYAELGSVERVVPWIFLAANLAVLAVVWL